jgi:NAD(P)-dependent dehydrogenase (short-subunit alcohol dehydrogenase family)
MRLADKVAIITGGGSGLGRESSLLFSQEGAKVVVADVDADRGDMTAKLVREAGGTAIAITTDVRNEDDVEAVVQATVSEYGKLDIMMANAGVLGPAGATTPVDEVTAEQWHAVMEVNATGVFYSVKHAARALKRQRTGGAILAVSSAASLAAYPSISAYSASKGAINAFVRVAANDLGRFGIRVNAICPTHGMSPNFLMPPDADVVGTSYEERNAKEGGWDPAVTPMSLKLGRPPSLRDNANVALFLVSDESTYVSGVTMPSCDGGTLSKVAIFFEDNWHENVVADA